MTRLKILGATAILASALTAPAMAQQVIYNPGYCAQFYPNANCQNKGPGNPYTGDYQRQAAYRQDGTYGRASYDRNYDRTTRRGYYREENERRATERDHRFWPGDVAAGVVGGAIGTAGSIATAPFRNDSYAYYNNGYYNGGPGWSGQTYAQRNGFVCTPGSWVKGDDGRRHRCQ
jgi:hypothetical protein